MTAKLLDDINLKVDGQSRPSTTAATAATAGSSKCGANSTRQQHPTP
jgi:hypothetical protein